MTRPKWMKAVALAALMTTGCSTFHRSDKSGYDSAKNQTRGLSPDRRAYDRAQTTQELGAEADSDAINNRTRLKKAEAALEGRRERDQYFKNKPYMKSDRDRLAFLTLETFEERGRWLTAHGVFGNDTPNSPEIQALIDINDLTTGMTKQAVRDSWGEPELVEVAGNPLYGNERWAYREQLPSSDGYQTEKRVVYFEGGRVVGWERH